MSAIILFPENSDNLPSVNVYRADTVDGVYALIDTVGARQLEYEDIAGDYSKFYEVEFTDGQTTSSKVRVKSFIQKIIDIIRIELKVPEVELPDYEVEFLFDSVKGEIMSDICNYTYGLQISKVEEGIYQLPNKYFFDANFGGAVSVLDIDLFKQVTPLTINSPKIPVEAVDMDVRERYVELAEPLTTNEILKLNYFSIGRELRYDLLYKMVAYKICSLHYENLYTAVKDNPRQKVKIGDITIDKGTKTPTVLQDTYRQMNAKYQDLTRRVKVGFFRKN